MYLFYGHCGSKLMLQKLKDKQSQQSMTLLNFLPLIHLSSFD